MCTSKFIWSLENSVWIVFTVFIVLECDRDLECLQSLGLKGGPKEEVYRWNECFLE